MQSGQQCLIKNNFICWQHQDAVWMPQAAATWAMMRAVPHAAVCGARHRLKYSRFQASGGQIVGAGHPPWLQTMVC